MVFIGKDDSGKVKPLANARKLLEDIPNQVRDLLCLMVDVNLHTEAGNDFLEIVVEPYPFPISLRGKYYYRSGSTLQELKGKLLFSKQIQHNFIHQERFYTKYQSFDRENFFNRVLLKTLKVIPFISDSPALKDRVSRLLLEFPELEDINVEPDMFENIQYNRRTLRYAEAIEIAAMILLQYRPDIKRGQKHILALLFNMNDLWEEYIFRQILKHKNENWKVFRQIKRFWKLNESRSYKVIKPDIVITDNDYSIIIDTKWKMPEKKMPSDADLKQMFVYNDYWKGLASILLYPDPSITSKPEYIKGFFVKDSKFNNECGVMRVSVLSPDQNGLDRSIGSKIVMHCARIFDSYLPSVKNRETIIHKGIDL
jgi:5-methylcytosine-specific restriction enzyme subunit McrC